MALYVPSFRSYKLVNFHNPATGLCKAQLVYQISVYKWQIQLGKPTRIGQVGNKIQDNLENIEFDYDGLEEYEDYGAESKLKR